MQALWITEAFADEAKRQGFKPVDNLSVLLTHLSEVIRANLAQLLSYKDMRGLLDRLDPEYKLLLGIARGLEDSPGRTCIDQESSSHPRGNCRGRAPCETFRAGRRARSGASCPADLRRSVGNRCAERCSPWQSLGSGISQELEA